jgi:Raf kinase inhibitor-like YbhB/YbcL family protein
MPTGDADFTPLTSPAFAEGGDPRVLLRRGRHVAATEWTEGSEALALLVDDPDAGGFVHWVAFDIDPALGGLAAGASTAAGAPPQGRNSFGQTGYGGPCPPSGTHDYVFRLLALDQELGLSGTPDAASVLAAADGHMLGEAQLTGTYTRGG